MNREFARPSRRARAALAAVAFLSTLLVFGGIEGLAGHYHDAGTLASNDVAPAVASAQYRSGMTLNG